MLPVVKHELIHVLHAKIIIIKKSRKEGARDLLGQVVTLLVAFLKARGGG
jgi:hypothetical protein